MIALICTFSLPALACEEAHAARVSTEPDKEAKAAVAESVKPKELGMDQLIERLKNTDAIGFITKLAIRSDVMDFKAMVDRYKKRNEMEQKCEELRSHFDGLLLKIMALLEGDPQLAEEIYLAKERIWSSFMGVEV